MLMFTGSVEVIPDSVSQSSTWGGKSREAEAAIDGDLATNSHTQCVWDTDLWYRMKFDAVYCFSEVVIMQSHLSEQNAKRMQDTNVVVVNSGTEAESLCGILEVSSVYTQEGQTYSISCDRACGDKVKLTLRHDRSQYKIEGCIHMIEIKAYPWDPSTGSKY